MPEAPRYLRVSQVARSTGLGLWVIRAMADEGDFDPFADPELPDIPTVIRTRGGHRLINEDAVERYKASLKEEEIKRSRQTAVSGTSGVAA